MDYERERERERHVGEREESLAGEKVLRERRKKRPEGRGERRSLSGREGSVKSCRQSVRSSFCYGYFYE